MQAARTKVEQAASKPSKAQIQKEYKDDLNTVPWCKLVLGMILQLVFSVQALNANALSFVGGPSNDTLVAACGPPDDWPAADEDVKVCLVKTKKVAFNAVASFPEHAAGLRRNAGLR